MKNTETKLAKLIILMIIGLGFLNLASAQVSCGSSCITASQVASETAKCLFIYDGKVYEPPAGTIGGRMHKNRIACGSDATGSMPQSHIADPNHYLLPYVCAPLCTSAPVCRDIDADGYQDSACGGNDCNDNNPAIHPGAAETCNSVDDNCNGQADENLQKSETCGVGACRVTVTRTCSGGVYAPSCIPKTPVSEVCGNSIDDNCDGQADEGCGLAQTPPQQPPETQPPTESQNPVTENPPDAGNTQESSSPPSQTGVSAEQKNRTAFCLPACSNLCGQDNGCGGNCPNTDLYAQGKCGNPACLPKCTETCGQSDSCGGYCPSTDAKSCGLCGNEPCCVPEVCNDNKDNDCNGKTDEGCGVLGAVTGMFANDQNPPASLIVNPGFLTRLGGLLAFFFSGITIIVGIFRNKLIGHFSRKEVLKYHALLGFFSLFFLVLHISALFFDKGGWADTVSLKNIFIPDLSGYMLFSLALGTIALYLFLVTMASGIFFTRIAKRFGYSRWLLIHRASMAFYAVSFFHALRIGTDFKNPYVIIFSANIIAVMALYIIFWYLRAYGVADKIKGVIDSSRIKRLTIAEILTEPELENKKVITSGTIAKPSSQRKSAWFQILDEYRSLFAIVPEGIIPDYYSEIEGWVKKENDRLYIDVRGVRK